MKSFFKPVLLAGLLSTAGFAAFSQAPPAGHEAMMGQGGMHGGMGMNHGYMGKMDPARMQAKMEQRSAALKAQLKLSAAQEAAWTTFMAAMKPSPAMMANRPDHAELVKLPTPERIDKMQALHEQHMTDMAAAMKQRGEATKVFYAVLTPEQKKVFDASPLWHHGRDARKGGPKVNKAVPAPKQ